MLVTKNQPARADIFYENDVIQGDRAVGLGGAFGAIADDASGVIYNPAGMAFAQTSNLSGAANAFYTKNIRYKKAVGNRDFVEKSQGFFPSFLGGLQKINAKPAPVVLGFAVYAPHSEFKDQDDIITAPEVGVKGFHRTVNQNTQSLHVALGAATRVLPEASFGATLTYRRYTDLTQNYQDSILSSAAAKSKLSDSGLAKGEVFRAYSVNQRSQITIEALEPQIGTQWIWNGVLSMGLSMKYPIIISQKSEVSKDDNTSYEFLGNSDDAGSVYAVPLQESDLLASLTSDEKKQFLQNKKSVASFTGVSTSRHFIRSLPWHARLSSAWFANTRWLMAFDVTYTSASSNDERTYFKREPVINMHLGTEYYLTTAIPLRLGAFTNRDSRPSPQGTSGEQIHYWGSSATLAWAQRSSQVSLGSVAQWGKGLAKKIQNSAQTQQVQAFSHMVVFTATHTME